MKLLTHPIPKFSPVSHKRSSATASLSEIWGWFPALSLVSATGVLLVALAYEGGRISAQQWPEPLFWLGLAAILLPIAARLVASRPTRRERIALLIVLTISLYCVEFLPYPIHFSGYDEFAHWRTTQDILISGHLFHENPLLPISPFYPGLEIATSAVSNLTGLSIFVSGTILISTAHLIFVLSLYLLYEHISGSARVAGIATAFYMANPQFLFFDMDFSYESFALPLAVFVLFMAVSRSSPAGRQKWLSPLIWLGLGAVVVTHHVTSYAFVVFLLLWMGVFLLFWTRAFFRQNRTHKDRWGLGPIGIALLGVVLCIVWLKYTGYMAVNYLSPHIESTVQQLLQIFTNKRPPRQLFQNNSGLVIPLWERMLSYTSVALILLGLLSGLLRIWQRHRANTIVVALSVGALLYPAGQALRLSPAGAETGNRTTEFVFVGVAFVLAISVTEFWLSHQPGLRRFAILLCATGLLCFGQLVLGSGQPSTLLPGPYLVSADARSIEPEGITAAEWANTYLGPGHYIAGDRDNTLLMATYGYEQVITGGSATSPIAPVFTSHRIGPGVVGILQGDRIQYLLVDRRLSTSLPYVGTYFNLPANGGQQNTRPIDPAALAKFDGVQGVSRIFDSGDIIIYNVESIARVPVSSPPQHTHPVPARQFRPARPKKLSQPIAWVRRFYLWDILTQ